MYFLFPSLSLLRGGREGADVNRPDHRYVVSYG